MAVKAILIDLDDTLVVEVASAEAAFLATCALAQDGYGIDPKALCQTVRQKAQKLWRQSPSRAYCLSIGISSWEGLWARFLGDSPCLQALRAWSPTYRRESWAQALAEYGINTPSFVERLAETFPRERRTRHIVYPDVRPVLQELGERYSLALITNGAPDLQREKLDGSGLAPYFDTIVVSGEVGIGKPDPQIFDLALDRLSTRSKDAVMVGNSLRSDIGGAQGAGIKGIWLNRSGKSIDRDIAPDAQITGLDELTHVLTQIECQVI
jgi:phosphoserine phosphatase